MNPPPGPWQLPVIGSLHHLVGALPHRAMRDLALRHGPLMLLRMGELPVVVASSADKASDAFLASLEEGAKVAAGFSLPDLFPSSRLARALSGTARRVEAVVGELSRLMDAVIEDKRDRKSAGAGDGDEEEDILDVLLRLQHAEDAPLDIGTIRAVIRDLFGAGSETSATTLQWAKSELMRNPAALRRAQAEVRGVLAGLGHSRVREDALPELRYLQLVIKETLRLHAPVPLLLPRECREPCRVMGYDVPQGAMVLVNAWAIGRDSASWGPDVEEFRPERFEDAVPAVDFKGSDFEFVPFGAGRRMCPGITFGVTVMELALASLLFHFDWELPGNAGGQLDMEEALGITARRKSDLWLHATIHSPYV